MNFNLYLNSILWILMMISVSGILFLIFKKIPAILAMSEESLTNKETFSEFVNKIAKNIPHQLREYEIAVLERATKNLLKFKIIFLKFYNSAHYLTEVLNKRMHRNKTLNNGHTDQEQKSGEVDQSLL